MGRFLFSVKKNLLFFFYPKCGLCLRELMHTCSCWSTVVGSDIELRGCIVLLTLLAFLPSVISSFFPRIRGGLGSLGPSPRSATEFKKNYKEPKGY